MKTSRLNIILPETLKKQIKVKAAQDGVSVTAALLACIAEYLAGKVQVKK